MLTLYFADAEKDVSMKNLSPKEAIAILSDMKIDIPVPKAAVTQRKRNTALDMAINALNCSEIPNSSDTISRRQAIDALKEKVFHNLSDEFYGAMQVLDELPSAQPERKKGRWIESNPQNSKLCRLMTCSECGKAYIVNINVPYEDWTEAHKFCVECGTKMKNGDQG